MYLISIMICILLALLVCKEFWSMGFRPKPKSDEMRVFPSFPSICEKKFCECVCVLREAKKRESNSLKKSVKGSENRRYHLRYNLSSNSSS